MPRKWRRGSRDPMDVSVDVIGMGEGELAAFLGMDRRDRNRDNRTLGGKSVVWRLLCMFGPRVLGQWMRDLGYSRLEYLRFLVDGARNPENPAALRMLMFERLDDLARIVGASHPAIAEWLSLDPVERKERRSRLRLRGDRNRLMVAKRNIEYRLRKMEGMLGEAGESAFASYLEGEEKRMLGELGSDGDGAGIESVS